MYETLVKVRNSIVSFLYKRVAKPIFFKVDPEKIHGFFIKVGKGLGTNLVTKGLTSTFFQYRNKALSQEIDGITFKNPVGLAAGFDKDAYLTDILPSVGFGFMEVGSITGEECAGNPTPRLWRLKKSKGLVVHYGLNNEGAEKIAERLKGKSFHFPLGISIAKTNCKNNVKIENGIKDYTKAFNLLKDIPSYITINISCPNAFGGQPFTNGKDLDQLLSSIDHKNLKKPLYLKMPPDLDLEQMDDILKIAEKHNISGYIATNLTKDYAHRLLKPHIKDDLPGVGGISGKPVENLTNEAIKNLYQKTKGKKTIIGCGGIFTAEDAYKKIRLGASLLQLITGMIFEGPQVISEINQGLVKLLEKDGFVHISDAIGIDNPIK